MLKHPTKNKFAWVIGFSLLLVIGWVLFAVNSNQAIAPTEESNPEQTNIKDAIEDVTENQKETEVENTPLHEMAIESLRQGDYPGGEFVIEETLSNGTNYRRYVASYLSEGLTIYGLLTVPLAEQADKGFPAIMFVHGYIPPAQYSTINSYPTYQAYLARAGFVTFKPDLRGHGNSEGEPSSAHYSADYIIDTLNALAYLKQYQAVDPERIGYWGHSNGGEIGLRTILVDQDIKAASFWAGVVGSYEDMFETYVDDIPFLDNDENPLVQEYGLPSTNPDFWNTLEPYEYLTEINIPIELQHATGDASVPVALSRELKTALENADVDVTYIEYQGDDHNISGNVSRAWQASIEFFNTYLK